MARGKSARNIGKSGGSVKFGRNSSAAPSTGSSVGRYPVKNPIVGKQGGKKRLGNPSSSMTSTGRWGSK